MRLGKKGSLDDLVYIMGVILVFAISIIIIYKFVNAFSDGMDNLGDDIEGINDSRQAVNDIESIFPGTIDNTFLFLAIGLSIAAIIMAMMVRIHPIFFIFYFILLVIVIFMAGVFSNIYGEVATNPQLSDVANNLIFTTHIMRFLPIFVGVVGFVLAIVMYRNYQNA